VLTLEKIAVTAVATCLTPEIAASAIKQTSKEYSTKSLTFNIAGQALDGQVQLQEQVVHVVLHGHCGMHSE